MDNIHFDNEVREMTIAMFLAGKSEYQIERAIENKRRARWKERSQRRRRRAHVNNSKSDNNS